MRIHKEGGKPLMILLLVLGSLYLVFEYVWPMNDLLTQLFLVLAIGLIAFFLQFFRNPIRITTAEEHDIVCPADGEVVIVEKVLETEYFKEERMQVSIFMSPLNVHVNRFPIRGKVAYSKYHKGKFLVAWNPKSSLLNERTTVVLQHPSGQQLLYRQIAGALARRIINYAREGMIAVEGNDCGFIRFGSRVDLLLPLDADIRVEIGEKVRGGETLIGRLNG